MVLSPKGEDKYEMKYVPEDFDRYDQGFFAHIQEWSIGLDDLCPKVPGCH